MKTIDDFAVDGLRVLLRADLNVPLDGGRVADDGRIRASLPTLTALTTRGARVIVCAHLGRPGGKPDPAYSLAPVAARLGELLGHPVELAADTTGPAARAAVAALRPGGVVMLENLRFNAAETSKDDMQRGLFADQLAGLADLYVSDGFGAVHRKHASVYDVALAPAARGRLPGQGRGRRAQPADRGHPAAVCGGARRRQGRGQVRRVRQPDHRGRPDPRRRRHGLPLPRRPGRQGRHLAARGEPGRRGRGLPEPGRPGPDRAAVRRRSWRPNRARPAEVVAADAIPADQMGLDIGPQTAARFAAALGEARTVFWNGPMGMFEREPYAGGTRAVARAMTGGEAFTVVGGGDTGAAIRALGFAEDAFGYVSTGGGASLEFIQGKTLPGLAVLEQS